MIKRVSYFLLVIITNFLWVSFNAQTSSFVQITENQGLPSSEVYQLIQDDLGYLYIGCSEGLFKYDGFGFKSISNSKQNARSVSHFIKDRTGKIWCQNFSGQIYFVKDDSLVIFNDFSKETVDYPHFVVDDSLNVWVGLKGKLSCYNKYGTINNYTINDMSSNFMFINIDRNNNPVYSIHNKGLFLFNRKTNKQILLSNDSIFLQRSNSIRFNNELYFLYESNPSKRYVIYKLSDQKFEKLFEFKPEQLAREIYQVRPTENGYWISTSNGAYYFTKDDFINPKFHLFKGQEISSSIDDKEGNLWFSSLSGGLFLTSLKSANVSLCLENNANPFTSFNIFDDQILVGDISGKIYKGNLNGDNLVLINEKPQNAWRRVNKILKGKDTYFIARNILNETDFGKSLHTVKTNYIRDMQICNDKVYIITSINLLEYDINLRKQKILTTISARKLLIDTINNVLYLSSGKGLHMYKNNKLEEVLLNGGSIYVNGLANSGELLWVNSLKNGIICLKSGKVIKQFFEKETLENRIKCITADTNNLYLVTEKGVYRYNFKSDSKSFIGKSLQVNFQSIFECRVNASSMFLLSRNAVYTFPLNYFGMNSIGPKVNITKVVLKNGKQFDTTLHQINYDLNSIDFHFKAFSYSSQGQLVYKYRLVGSSGSWKIINAAIDHVTFEAIPPGSYTFEVYAINSDGVQSDYPARYKFLVIRPFYMQNWFVILLIILLFIFIYFLFKWQMLRVRKKAILEKSVAEQKLIALKAQMNPHFMFNALNSIQDLIIKQDVKNSNLYLSKFSNLTRKILEHSENEKILIVEEVEMLELYLDLEKLRFGDDFQYEIMVDESIESSKSLIPSLMLQPFVENAIKHGLLHKKGIKRCMIHFINLESGVLIKIVDNGIGRKRSGEIKMRNKSLHRSYATAALYNRVELLNTNREIKIKIKISDLVDHDEILGTEVEIFIPKEFMN